MEIKEFGLIMAREVKDALGEEYEVKCNEIIKNNGVVRSALIIRKEDEFISPTIYLDSFFEKYNAGVMVMSLVSELIKMYQCSTVPANLLAHAKIEKEAEIAGVGNRAEIWSKAEW